MHAYAPVQKVRGLAAVNSIHRTPKLYIPAGVAVQRRHICQADLQAGLSPNFGWGNFLDNSSVGLLMSIDAVSLGHTGTRVGMGLGMGIRHVSLGHTWDDPI